MELSREARHLVEEFKDRKRQALLHLLSDGAAGTTFFLMLAFMRELRVSLFSTVGRIFGGLSDTAKAFLIIASPPLLPAPLLCSTWQLAITACIVLLISVPAHSPICTASAHSARQQISGF